MSEENNRVPQCVGFIMDGNRRWAEKHGVTSLEGHFAGYEALKNTVRAVYGRGIPHMVCYAFSTENWKRSDNEIAYLLNLIGQALRELPELLRAEGVSLVFRVIGERERFSHDLNEAINSAEEKDPANPEITVWIALSYGGRAEILRAANKAIAEGVPVTERTFANLLWTKGMPDPDIVIRTSGEKRISNFLLWQVAYSELFFVDTLWPDFGKMEFERILDEYETRDRRNGA